MRVKIELAENTAKHFGDSPEAIARALVEKAALEDFRSERISAGKLSEILGLDRWQTDAFLAQHQAARPYTLVMLEEDRRNLAKILCPA